MRQTKIFIRLLLILLLIAFCKEEAFSKRKRDLTSQKLCSSETLEKDQFCVGYSKIIIDPSPDGGAVPLIGYGNSRARKADPSNQPSKQSLCATTIFIDDNKGSKSIIITLDLLEMGEDNTKKMKTAIYQETSVPIENITIACTHTHSGPDVNLVNEQVIKNYLELLKQKIVEGVIEASLDLSPCTAEVAKTNVTLENGKNALNFVRHYSTNTKDKQGNSITRGDNHGTYGWDGTKYIETKKIDHITVADNTLQMIKFKSLWSDKQDIVLINFQTHATTTGCSSCLAISADFIAPFRETLSQDKNCKVAYFSGAGADVNPSTSLNTGEGIAGITHNVVNDPSLSQDENKKANSLSYGKKLAEYAEKIYNQTKKVELSHIINRQSTVKLFYALFNEDMLSGAKYINTIWNSDFETIKTIICGTYDWGDFVFPKGFDSSGKKIRQLLKDNGKFLSNKITFTEDEETGGCTCTFANDATTSHVHTLLKFVGSEFENIIQGPFHANRINENSKYKKGDYKDVKISSVNLGGISFAAGPYEMFHENGKYIKENSNNEMTFILSNAGAYEGYLPSSNAFDYGSYESDTCKYEKGCAESLAEEFVKIINQDTPEKKKDQDKPEKQIDLYPPEAKEDQDNTKDSKDSDKSVGDKSQNSNDEKNKGISIRINISNLLLIFALLFL